MNAQPTDIARRNQLLNGLTEQELSELANDLELRTLRVRDPIVRRHEVIADIYFPVSCVLSTVAEGAANQTVEVATIGNEGHGGASGIPRRGLDLDFRHVCAGSRRISVDAGAGISLTTATDWLSDAAPRPLYTSTADANLAGLRLQSHASYPGALRALAIDDPRSRTPR